MLLYWNSEFDGYLTYSVDMVRFDFTLPENAFDSVFRYLSDGMRSDIDSFGLSTTPFKYRHLFNINYEFSSMTIGIGFNGISKADFLKCFCEFNPNKVFLSNQSFDDLFFLWHKCYRFKIRRLDIALDIPIARHLVRLVKDQRKYSLTMKSESDKTEYLGTRNSGGFVKLYNKKKESKLDNDLTRLEITLDRNMINSNYLSYVPDIEVIPQQYELLLESHMSEKDKLLVELLRMHPEMFSRLDYRNRVKFKPYVFDVSSCSGVSVKFQKRYIDKCIQHFINLEK